MRARFNASERNLDGQISGLMSTAQYIEVLEKNGLEYVEIQYKKESGRQVHMVLVLNHINKRLMQMMMNRIQH